MRTLNKVRSGAKAWICFLTTFCAAVCLGQSTITNIPTLGGSMLSVTALNRLGQVGGYATRPGDAAQHAFLFSGGAIYDLGTLGGSFSVASALNNRGGVAGYAYTALDAAQHAFLYTSNGMTDLGTLTGGSYSSARAINDGCQVIGEADTTNSQIHGFVFRDGTL